MPSLPFLGYLQLTITAIHVPNALHTLNVDSGVVFCVYATVTYREVIILKTTVGNARFCLSLVFLEKIHKKVVGEASLKV